MSRLNLILAQIRSEQELTSFIDRFIARGVQLCELAHDDELALRNDSPKQYRQIVQDLQDSDNRLKQMSDYIRGESVMRQGYRLQELDSLALRADNLRGSINSSLQEILKTS